MRLDWISRFDSQNFQLDIVGFLAILGEGSVATIAQVACLSVLIYVPRLIPAPQTFIRPTRPERLETTSNAKVVGIYSGNSGEDVHHVAHALHRGDKLLPNTVKCVRVREKEDADWPSPKRLGPLAFLAFIGFGMSCGLLTMSIYYRDGMALLATAFLSILSSVAGAANKWEHKPGAFIIVKCEEVTARYLYFNPAERCNYFVESSVIYRGLSLISTLLLMGGVISLANAKIQLQLAFACAYMSINIFYWIGAALPPASHWDLSRLELEDIELHGGTPPRKAANIEPSNPTYTQALWKAIAVTGTKTWVRESGWAPKTPVWDDWLLEAEDAAMSEPMRISHVWNDKLARKVEVWTIRNWDYKNVLSTLLKSRTTTNIARMT